MNFRSQVKLESILEKVDPSRRAFLKRIFTGAGVAALVTLPASTLLAQVPPAGAGENQGQVPPGENGPRDGGGRGGRAGGGGGGRGDGGRLIEPGENLRSVFCTSDVLMPNFIAMPQSLMPL